MLIHLIHLGRIDYLKALAVQQRIVELRQQQRIGDVLLLLEHPPVLTLGRNARRANILASDEELARRGISVHEIDRGGDVTYHGPGQVVGYPILDLRGDFPGKRGPHLGAVEYVRWLEEALIRTCAEYGVLTQRVCGANRGSDAAGRQYSGKENRRDRGSYFARCYIPRVRVECDCRSAGLRTDRSLWDCRRAGYQPGGGD